MQICNKLTIYGQAFTDLYGNVVLNSYNNMIKGANFYENN